MISVKDQEVVCERYESESKNAPFQSRCYKFALHFLTPRTMCFAKEWFYVDWKPPSELAVEKCRPRDNR
jgi:hypothetical protein